MFRMRVLRLAVIRVIAVHVELRAAESDPLDLSIDALIEIKEDRP